MLSAQSMELPVGCARPRRSSRCPPRRRRLPPHRSQRATLTVVHLHSPRPQAEWWRVDLYAGFCTEPCGPVMAIPLGRRLPAGSCGLPEGVAGGQPIPSARPCSGWGLSSRRGHPRRWCALTAPFHPYLCCLPEETAIGGLFSVALSCESPRLGVTQHPALWSPDVPRPGHLAGPYAALR